MAASRTWQLSPLQPTFVSGIQLLAPRTTPSPSAAEPNEVVIELTTTLFVPDYARFYSAPISTFQPAYIALPDGSLATAVLMDDLARSYLSLLVTGMLATLFLRNILVCFDYIRRGNMQRKTLFYLLLASQLLALALVPLLASYFSQHLDCTVVVVQASTATGISLTLLMVILGLKAYRCLDSSRVVLSILIFFFCASTALLGLLLGNLQGIRRLSGSCIAVPRNVQFTRIYVLIQLSHSLFICCCFLYAVWKSRSSPTTRGRLSIQVSLEEYNDAVLEKPTRRAWWENLTHQKPSGAAPASDLFGGPRQPHGDGSTAIRRKPGLSHFLRKTSDPILEQPLNPSGNRSPSLRAPSFSRLIPRMELFHKVMKDELCYTATITVNMVIITLILVLGVNVENNLNMTGWIQANWAITSVLVIHSFGRVVRRHEREVLMQYPSAWWSDRDPYRASPYSRNRAPRSQMRLSGSSDDDSPFSDTRGLRESMLSVNSELIAASPSSPSPIASTRDRRLSSPSAYPDFPNSNRSTAQDLVRHDSADPSFIPILSSWRQQVNGSSGVISRGSSVFSEKVV